LDRGCLLVCELYILAWVHLLIGFDRQPSDREGHQEGHLPTILQVWPASTNIIEAGIWLRAVPGL